MLKKIINYLKNNRIDCHTDKSARNDRVCHYGRFALCRTKQFAFTLAETLIVMGIIGVVAALTLPNLNSSTGDKEKVAKVKKIYSNLEDAVGRAQAVYGPADEWCVNYSGSCRDRIFERVTEFLKVSKVCNTVSSCPNLVFSANGNSNGDSGHDDYYQHSVILADGTVVGIDHSHSHDDFFGEGSFLIDIDGTNKGANTDGKDVFKFFWNKNGLRLGKDGIIDEGVSCEDSKYCFPGDSAYWIIKYGNMDYLKAGTDGKTCPDGKTILDGTTNTTCK